MIRGLYAATSGALVAQANVDTVANNLANVNTGGFKRTLLQVEAAPSMPLHRIQTDPGPDGGEPARRPVGPLGFGALVHDTPAIFDQGALRQTGNPLDVALSGAGFFTLQTPQGTRYTRDGAFARNAQGLLTTQSGDLVLGRRGAIALPPGDVQIDGAGNVSVDGQTVDTLRITEFANLASLRPEGASRFADAGGARPTTGTRQTTVAQKMLESSNSDVVHSMVDLITAERWFDANEKVIQTEDGETGLAISTLGRSTPR